MKKYNILQSNPKTKYQGTHYAITGFGGFEINTQTSVQMKTILQFGKYDLTNALQITMNKDVFNSKIGFFDTSLYMFEKDILRIESNEFSLSEEQIVSLGSLETIYMDFKKYVYDYFNMNEVVNIFNENIPDMFDKEELCSMIKEDKCTGYIELIGINDILKNLLDYNICGNRENNVEIYDGFINGDIVYIPDGLSIMLSVDCGLTRTYKYDISIRLE